MDKRNCQIVHSLEMLKTCKTTLISVPSKALALVWCFSNFFWSLSSSHTVSFPDSLSYVLFIQYSPVTSPKYTWGQWLQVQRCWSRSSVTDQLPEDPHFLIPSAVGKVGGLQDVNKSILVQYRKSITHNCFCCFCPHLAMPKSYPWLWTQK